MSNQLIWGPSTQTESWASFLWRRCKKKLIQWWRVRKDPVLRHILSYRKAHPDRIPFVVKGHCVMNDEGLYEHCRIAREQGLPELWKASPTQPVPMVIVGSGLSALGLLEEIRKHYELGHPIMAIKGAHDWLMENGIVPQFAVAADPQQDRHDCFKKRHKDVIYLCASQMHPDTWSYMKDYQVVLWHCQIEANQMKKPGWEGVPLVPGGSTTGLRSISLARILGFPKQELYGFDSCVTKDRTLKLDGTKMRDEDELHEVWIGEYGPYLTSTAMIPQVHSLGLTLKPWGDIRLNAHGDGYFQAALKQAKKQGWPV